MAMAMARTPNKHSPQRPAGRGDGVSRRPYAHGGGRVRSLAHRRSGSRFPAIPEPEDDWTQWPELTVRLTGIPWKAGTLDLWNLLSPYGWVKSISLEENNDGNRSGEAAITFSPVPGEAFWESWKPEDSKWIGVRIEKQYRKRTFQHRSPVDSSKTYPEQEVSIDH